ncbi:calcium-binding protein [Gluconobacter japonicus]|uniref:beta strand repeat-containing protein n=1 Tax=Gluconobacter japonicus TaxID=376620 RepID=UPI001B8B513D|nr:calcium-binding protein [Gluconobacter japonicus]MBS1051806.1 calcium-binding protein [Gluconobacter japonicus]
MAITTVVGASGQILAVTVDGAQAQALANQYSSAISGVSGLTSYDLVPGSNSSFSAGVSQGVLTQSGSYSINGDVQYIAAGSYAAQDTLTGSVAIDLSKNTASSVSLLTGAWDGVSVVAGNQSGSVVSSVGNNFFLGAGKTGSWNIVTGSGNDTILGSNGNNTIDGGTGNNLIYLGSGTNVVRSEGQDTIDGSNGTDTVTLLGGSSVVNLHANATVYDTTGSNSVTVGNNSFITGGSSSTYFTTGASATVSGGLNDTISAAGDLQQIRGTGNTISVDGSLSFLNGTGNTTITAGNATLFGASGLNVQFDGTSGYSLFVGTGGDETISAASSHGVLEAFASNGGNTTIIGGTGADTLVAGSGNATFTGGSGGSNLFALNGGLAGGDYTITDFGSAAGNLVALYRYGLQNNDGLQNVLSAATVAGGNTTIALNDGSKITFVGVTDLKASDFTLS